MKKMDVVFLIDRSGSMYDSVCDTIGGFNSYLDSLKDKENVKVTTILFDNEYEVLYDRVDINNVKYLTEKDYYVRGSTALYDAIGKTINSLAAKIKNKVLFIITTDGYENSSLEYNKDRVKKMIEKHKSWEFIYLGASIDSYKEGAAIGIRKDNISNYTKSKTGTKKMFEALECASNMVYEERLTSDWKSKLQ